MIELLFILLPVAAATGWYYGYQSQHRTPTKSTSQISRDYFVGLNYLLDEQTDKAVDIFIKMIEVDSDTVETHLALGNLFRRRGEVDRAIRIHQNLIARPALDKAHRVQALLMLGQDYLRAGLLDRAERLFLQVVETGERLPASLRCLLDIYQQQHRWGQAITIAKQLEKASGDNLKTTLGHYHCEQAELVLSQKDDAQRFFEARRHLTEALACDPNCVRASILLGEIEVSLKNHAAAIAAYQRVKVQDPEFLSEITVPLVACYRAADRETELIAFLETCLQECPGISVVLALGEYQYAGAGCQQAIDFIAEQLRVRPSLRGLKRLIELQMQTDDAKNQTQLAVLQRVAQDLIAIRPIYRCIQCGFNGRRLYWQCPGCKSWSSVRPVHGLEGD